MPLEEDYYLECIPSKVHSKQAVEKWSQTPLLVVRHSFLTEFL